MMPRRWRSPCGRSPGARGAARRHPHHDQPGPRGAGERAVRGSFVPRMPACTSRPCRTSPRRSPGSPAHSGGWAVTASSARSLMPAVDAIGADLAHQYRLAYATTYPALTATRLRVAVAGAGTTATAEATVRVPASYDRSAAAAQASAAAPRRVRRVRGLADRRGVAGRPGRRGHRRPAARGGAAPAARETWKSRADRLAPALR